MKNQIPLQMLIEVLQKLLVALGLLGHFRKCSRCLLGLQCLRTRRWSDLTIAMHSIDLLATHFEFSQDICITTEDAAEPPKVLTSIAKQFLRFKDCSLALHVFGFREC